MDLNTAMRFVMVRASAEVAASRLTDMRVEHLFLGLLKLAEVTAEDIAPSSHHKKQINEDIHNVKTLFLEKKIDTAYTRALLRGILQKESDDSAGNGRAEVADLLAKADEAAEKEKADAITAVIILRLVLEHPTPILCNLCNINMLYVFNPQR